jgi:quinoprotein glucose dehydrogenase
MAMKTSRALGMMVVALVLLVSCRVNVNYSGPVAEWPDYGADKGGSRHSPLDQITKENVGSLKVAWTYRSGDISDGNHGTTTSSLQVTPIVVDDVMYFCTPFNRVIALDADSGHELWKFDPGLKNRQLHGGYPLTCRGVSTWLDPNKKSGELCARRILTGTQDSELIALDAATGKPCPDFGQDGRVQLREGLGDAPDWETYPTSPPLVVSDIVVVGGLVADNIRINAPPGVVRAFDVRTGRLRWAWDPVPPNTEKPAAPAPDGSQYRRATSNVWGIMSADPQRDLIFLPTGNAPPDYWGGLRQGLDYFTDCIVALRASTGQLVWRFQTVHHDLWDYDLAAQPTLFDYHGPNGTVPALAQAAKTGHVFLLNRETGQPLFPVEERPIPQDPADGETLSPTQPFPTSPPPLYESKLQPQDAYGFTFWDRGKCREKIEQHRSEGIFTPPSTKGSIHFPSAAGGVNWGGGSFDPERQLFVVNQTRVASLVTLVPRAEYDKIKSSLPTYTKSLPGTTALYGAQEGTPYAIRRELLLSPWGAPCNSPPWGTLTAVDLSTGKVRWQSTLGTTREMAPWPLWLHTGVPNLGGPITTASGLVFIAAATDNYLRAFDTETGAELWKARLPFAGHATPLTYRLKKNGKQLVVIAAGGHVFSKNQGDAIVAFSL